MTEPTKDTYDVLLDPKVSHDEALEHEGEFYLIGQINEHSCGQLSQAMLRVAIANVKKQRPRPLVLNIHSGGGAVLPGIMLASTIGRIKEMGVSVHTIVLGSGMSMAVYILQAGSLRAMDVSSQLMLHDLHGTSWGDSDERFRREESYKLMKQNMAQVFASRNTAGHTDPQWWLDNYLQREIYLDAPRAVELGLVDYLVGSLPTPPKTINSEGPEAPEAPSP